MNLPELPEATELIDCEFTANQVYDKWDMHKHGTTCWNAAIDAALLKIEALISSHCEATGECDAGNCDIVSAWTDSIEILKQGLKK